MKRSTLLLSMLISLLIAGACSPLAKSTADNNPTPAIAQEPAQIADLKPDLQVQKIAFGSCVNQKKPQPIWDSIAATQPDLYLAMGDNIYASRPEDQPMAEQYRLESQVPEFKKFRAQTPILATWDDHDFGVNDGGAENPKIPDAKTLFLQFFPHDAKLIPESRKGVYHSFVFGRPGKRVQILFLDTRTYRSALEKNPNPKDKLDVYQATQDLSKTMLGEEQWNWLESELKKPAEVRFVVSSVQLIADEHGFEKWGNFPHERRRFFELLKKTKAHNVWIFSGDRHMAEISKINWPGVGDIYDVTASAINRPSNIQSEKNSHRIGQLYSQENFGLAQIDWKKGKVRVELRDLKGQLVQEVQKKIQTRPPAKQSHI